MRSPFERTDRGVNLAMIMMSSVAEVETEGVYAREKQRLEHLRRSARGTDGCDDFCPPTTHAASCRSLVIAVGGCDVLWRPSRKRLYVGKCARHESLQCRVGIVGIVRGNDHIGKAQQHIVCDERLEILGVSDRPFVENRRFFAD